VQPAACAAVGDRSVAPRFAAMKPDQINKLAQSLADKMPTLIWERIAEYVPPIKPANLQQLFIDKEDVRALLEGHLRSMALHKKRARDR
jgi:hypothetical protein